MTEENVIRLVNNRFSEKDVWVTLTYSDEKKPVSEEQEEINVNRFIRRLRGWMEENKVKTPLVYVCVTHSHKARPRHHIITNFTNKEVLEKLWDGGGRTMARRLVPDKHGHEGLVRYLLHGQLRNSLITSISE